MGSIVRSATIVLVAFKGICCSRRARFCNRQASIILNLVLSMCVFAAGSERVAAQSHDDSSTGFPNQAMKPGGDAPLEIIGELTHHLKSRARHHRFGYHGTSVHKGNRYARHHLQRRSHGPGYVAGPSFVGRDPALSEGPGRYPWRLGIITTIFWIGERPRGNNPVPNARSSWDKYWYYNYGGYDTPDPGSRRNFIPINFVPRQNPFYVALPYNDVEHGHTKYEAREVIPWFKQAFVRDGQTVLKNRWIEVRHANRVCYAQWEDCGPFRTDHWQYVFGNERPRPNLNQGAGLDVSPAVRDYLGLGIKDPCDWKFVEFREVPPGPWAMYGDNNTFVVLRHKSNERFAAK